MTAQDIYKELLDVPDNGKHLILAKMFSLVFSRNVRQTEWGHLRKLIKIYGSEIVYWALLNSSNITASGTPLVYVNKVCTGLMKSELETIVNYTDDTDRLLEEWRDYKPPDWDNILRERLNGID